MFAEIRKELFDALPFVLCTVGESRPQRAVDRPEGFDFHQFIWIAEGEGVFSSGKQYFCLGPGEGMFYRRGVPQSYHNIGELHTIWVTFRGAEGVLDYYHAPDAFRFRVPKFLPAATAALEEVCHGNSTILSRSAAGYNWLAELMEAIFSVSIPFSEQLRQFLENHYNEPLTLDDIAEQMGTDRFTLCRRCAQERGISPMEQLKKIRIAKARQFLRYTTRSVEEIGKMCGFDSPSYFGKRFREENGCSPREYRCFHGE